MSAIETSSNYPSNAVSNFSKEIQPKKKEPLALFTHLQIDIMKVVLSFLDLGDVQSTVQVSNHWKSLTIKILGKEQLILITKFVNFLGENKEILPTYTNNSCNSYLNIEEEFSSLIKIKSATLQTKFEIINQLKDLKEKDLNELEESCKITKPLFFEEIFLLSRISKQINQIESLSTEYLRNQLFEKTFIASIEKREIKKIKKCALIFSCEKIKSKFLKRLSQALIKQGDLYAAKEIALLIPQGKIKSEALETLSQKFLEKEALFEAKDIALLIPCKERKSKILIAISRKLEDEEMHEAKEVAMLIPDVYKRSETLGSISNKLLEKDRGFRSTTIALLIPNNNIKSLALYNIALKIVEKDVDKAREVALLIPSKKKRIEVLKQIYEILSQKGEREEALATDSLISIENNKNENSLTLSEAFKRLHST